MSGKTVDLAIALAKVPQIDVQEILATGNWVFPSGWQKAELEVLIVGGGGTGSRNGANGAVSYGGGSGEVVFQRIPNITANVAVTIGAGGAAISSGTTTVNGNSGSD